MDAAHSIDENDATTGSLRRAMGAALDGLLRALELVTVGDDRFEAASEPDRFDRVYGGQTVAQALMAASATVTGKAPHSLHAYFVEAGAPGQPVELVVDRVRDGRSMATRGVSVTQGERTLLTMIASFHSGLGPPERSDIAPAAPGPSALPRLQKWASEVPPALGPHAATWVESPPPIELRIEEPPAFLGGAPSDAARSHWMRLAGSVSDDPILHAVLLAYASDFLLLDMAFRSLPRPFSPSTTIGVSLDHAVWFHGPIRLDRWHRHTQQTLASAGDRCLVRGAIDDEEGRVVASVMQEVLVRQSG